MKQKILEAELKFKINRNEMINIGHLPPDWKTKTSIDNASLKRHGTFYLGASKNRKATYDINLNHGSKWLNVSYIFEYVDVCI